jgi:F-type H+-transporting ATPase subunit b
VHSAVVHLQGSSLQVHLTTDESTTTVVATQGSAPAPAEAHVYSQDPGPIVPEMKELYWGAGAFIVFALLMRFVLYPRLKKGMDARYAGIRSAHESADAERSGARAEVADYQSQLAVIKAEAARVLEAARATLESERSAKMAEVNARLAQQRATAAAEAEAVRDAARPQIHAAVSDVAGRAGELATGRRPASDVVDRVVSEVMAR